MLAILYIGTQVHNLKTHLTISCHANFKWICITRLPYYRSEMFWNNTSTSVWCVGQFITHYQYGDFTFPDQCFSHSRLKSSSVAELANCFSNSIINFVKNNSLWNFLITLGIIIGLVILLLFLLPVIFKRLGSALRTAQREIYTLHLCYLKEKDVKSHNGTS